MRLDRYFERIGYRGDTGPTEPVLKALQFCHVTTVPFENLDVHFGQELSTDAQDAYQKIVVDRRGGWCYEQNGLFGWALQQVGFDVTRIAAAVMQQDRGEIATANHLCLRVTCPDTQRTFLCDVGFGGSLLEPVELRDAEFSQAPFQLGLTQLVDGQWRFWEDVGRGKFSFDFNNDAADEQALRQKCHYLQTDPSSGFVLNVVAQIRLPEQHKSLRGRVFTTVSLDDIQTVLLESAEQFVAALATHFKLHVPEAADLWPAICARHDQLLRDKAIEDTFEIRGRANR